MSFLLIPKCQRFHKLKSRSIDRSIDQSINHSISLPIISNRTELLYLIQQYKHHLPKHQYHKQITILHQQITSSSVHKADIFIHEAADNFKLKAESLYQTNIINLLSTVGNFKKNKLWYIQPDLLISTMLTTRVNFKLTLWFHTAKATTCWK